ncbi:MAG: MFS transporter [Ktedonobacteraceae bacterium]
MRSHEERGDLKITSSLRIQIGLAFFAFILIGLNDGAIGVLIPSIQTHYNVNKATIGLLFLFATIGYLVAAFNSGLLVEKLGNRFFLILGVSTFLLSAATLSLMPPFLVVLLMLLPLGFGVAILDAGLNAYIAGLPRNTALLNYLHAFYGAGALLGPIIASTILAIGLGWNSAYVVWVGMSLLLLTGIVLAFKDTTGTPQGVVKAEAKSNVLLTVLRIRIVWVVALFLLFYVGTEVSLGSWSYSFLTEERHGSTLIMGWVVSGYWAGLTLGRLVLARVAQRVGEKRLIQGCLAGIIVGVLLVWLAPGGAIPAIGLCLTGFSLGPIYPTTIALMSRLVSSRLLASAIGFLASLGSMGAALFPWLAGNLAQFIGLWSLLPYVITLTVIMLCLWIVLQARPQVTHI